MGRLTLSTSCRVSAVRACSFEFTNGNDVHVFSQVGTNSRLFGVGFDSRQLHLNMQFTTTK